MLLYCDTTCDWNMDSNMWFYYAHDLVDVFIKLSHDENIIYLYCYYAF